ncbi:MAG: immune inhibitor A, partial [Gemmatimonadota bacterium]
MKSFFCSVVSFVLILFPFFIGNTASEEIVTSVTFSRSELTFERFENYDIVRMVHCDITREVGEPQLPVKMFHIAVPAGMKVSHIEILSIEREELEGTYTLFPVQPPQVLGRPGNLVRTFDLVAPKLAVYQSNEPYPEEVIELSSTGSLRGHRLACLLVHPLQYCPAQGKLTLFTKITIEVALGPDNTFQQGLGKRIDGEKDVGYSLAQRMVLNPQDVGAPSSLKDSYASHLVEGQYEYVIITDARFESYFRPLVEWKTRKGVPTAVITTSWIYEQYPGSDDQERIRNFIRDAYQNWGTVWVLIGGDTDVVPERVAWAMDCEYGAEPDENDIPADLYYSDLDGTWDDNGNGIYGEVDDNVDLYPDVFVGRAAVNTTYEVETFVRKILAYENPVVTDQFMRMLFLGEIMWDSPYTDGGEGKDMIDDECIPPRYDPITKLYQSKGNESTASVVAAMNEGYHIINHDGHCWWTVMGVGDGSLVSSDMDGLRNNPASSIIYSIGCWPAAIDYDCIAEHFVNNPRGGGVAFIGNSRYGWGSPGNPGYGYSDRFDLQFYVELFDNGISNIGATLAATKAFYVGRSRQENVYRIHQYEVNLLGDPEMDIWTNTPGVLTVDHPAEVPAGYDFFTVTVTSDAAPVEGSLVCLMNGADLFERGTTNSQGQVTFEMNTSEVDTIWVTVTAHDYIPYQGSAVVNAQGPYMGEFGHYVIHTPNGDGLINPGERIELNVSVINRGSETAINVVAVLKTGDPVVAITDSINGPRNLSPGGQAIPVWLMKFTFEVSSQAANGHSIQFTLEMSDSLGHVWTNIIPITVAAPVLICQSYSIDDSTGGNGNGLMEDGERISIDVGIKNAGLGIAYGVAVRPQVGSCDIALKDSLIVLNDIDPGSTTTGSFSLEFTDPDCPTPAFDVYTLNVNTSDGYSFTDGFSLARHQAQWGFYDDMEHGDTDTLWTYGGQGNLWHVTQHRSHSGDYSWYCGHEDRWRYDKHMDCSLISCPITLGPRAHLSFWHWYEVAVYGVNGIAVEIDDGSGWTKLDFIGSGGALQPVLPIGNDWIEDTYDLSEYPAGTLVQIRFHFLSDGERVSEGVYIDDVRVYNDYSNPHPLFDFVGYVVDDDSLGMSLGNGNGFVDPGETIELTIDVHNYGDAMAPGLSAVLTTTDPCATVLDGEVGFGNVASGTACSGERAFTVEVSQDTRNRHSIFFSLRLRDIKGNVWDESVSLTVAQPEFVFSSFTIDDVIG